MAAIGIERPVLVATNLKGRIHAYNGLVIHGTLRVPRRAIRSLCGVPCKGTSNPFVIDTTAEVCKVCCALVAMREE